MLVTMRYQNIALTFVLVALMIVSLLSCYQEEQKDVNTTSNALDDKTQKQQLQRICGIILPEEAHDIYSSIESLFTLSIYIRFSLPTHRINQFLSSNTMLPQTLEKGLNPLSEWTVTPNMKDWWAVAGLKNERGAEKSFVEESSIRTWYIAVGRDPLIGEKEETVYVVYILESAEELQPG